MDVAADGMLAGNSGTLESSDLKGCREHREREERRMGERGREQGGGGVRGDRGVGGGGVGKRNGDGEGEGRRGEEPLPLLNLRGKRREGAVSLRQQRQGRNCGFS